MADNFFKVKNGVNLPTLSADPTVTPPANSAAGDMAFYNGKLYIHNGTAWGIKPGSGSTGLIVNADVDAAAAIAGTKVNPAFGSQTITTTGDITGNGATSIISGVELRASAKMSVDANTTSDAVYVRQTGTGNALTVIDAAGSDTSIMIVDNAGNMGVGVDPSVPLTNKLEVVGNAQVTGAAKIVSGDLTFDTAKGIESHTAASSLNVGTGSNTSTVNIGTGAGVQTVNIGTGAGATTINIGATGDNVVVAGTLTTVNTTNLDVADKNITLNKGGAAGSANGAGINIEANSVVQASLTYAQTDGSAQPQDAFTFSGTGAVAVSSGTTAQRPNTPTNGMIRYNSTLTAFEGYAANTWSAIGGGGTIDKVNQAGHGFSVGHLLYLNGSTYAKAKADTAATAEVVGMVSRVVDVDNFELTLNGEVSGLTGLTAGGVYFLDATTAGLATLTEPTTIGQISVPIGVASNAAGTTMYVMPKRGVVVGSANAQTKIYLSNNATTNVQSVSAYDAGGLAGWVFLDGTTDYRFYVQAQFAKNAAGTDYNLSYQTTGDTPPAGFSLTVTAAGMVQCTLPSGAYQSATSFIQYALNAPAVGATLPLAIDSSLVQFSSVQAKDVNGISVKNAAGSTTNLFVSDAGNVGIGTTPSAVSSFDRVLQVRSFLFDDNSNGYGILRYNNFYNGTNDKYINSAAASAFQLDGNSFKWYNAPAGTAGNNVTFTQAMTLDASGNLLVGTTSVLGTNYAGTTHITGGWIGDDTPLRLRNQQSAAGRYWKVGPTSSGAFLVFNNTDTGMYMTWGATSWTGTSDERLKTDLKPIKNAAEKVCALRAVTGRFKTDEEGTSRSFLIAQDVQAVLPEAVDVQSDEQGTLGVRYTETIPLLVAAIKELKAELDAAKAEIEALKAK